MKSAGVERFDSSPLHSFISMIDTMTWAKSIKEQLRAGAYPNKESFL